jgi:hypothetical protein
MKHDREINLMQEWEALPSERRHFYFFVLLVLLTVLTADLYGAPAAPRRVQSEPEPPPRMTSKDVYPAPVNL